MPVLIVKTGSLSGRRFEIRKDAEIGRAAVADVVLADPSISRRHAALGRKGPDWVLHDLGSQNGTCVNGKRLREPAALKDGDEVRLGAIALEFREDPSPARRRPSSGVSLSHVDQTVLQSMKAEGSVEALLSAGDAADLARRLRLVYDVGFAISGTLDEETLLGRILDELFAVFPKADKGFVMLHDAATGEQTVAAVRSRSGETALPMSRTIVRDVLGSRRGILSVDALLDGRFPASESIQLLGIRSVVCVPMLAQEEILGIVTLYSKDATHSFTREDMALLLAIASQAGVALSRARLHERVLSQELLTHDLALARRIQLRFLPKEVPEVPGWSFGDHYAPALDVGGDYYDYLELPPPLVGVAIGDVSGKGVAAALVMAKLGSEVRYHSVGRTDPGEILTRVNRTLSSDLEEGVFITGALAAVDVGRGEVRLASAGHPAPLVRRASGAVEAAPVPSGVPLGVASGTIYGTTAFRLEAGDVAVLFTDGVTEAADRSGAFFGEERFRRAVAASPGTPAGVLKSVLEAVTRFAADQPPSDDITFVALGPSPR